MGQRSQGGPEPRRGEAWSHGAALVAAVGAAFGAALWNGFLWDDEVLILGNPLIRSFKNAGVILKTALWLGNGNYYRPLPGLTFLVDHALWGLDGAWGFHLTNLVLHASFAVLLYLLLKRRFSGRASFWASLLYAVHPVHAAAVVPVYARDNVLSATWLVALLALEASVRRPRAGWLALGGFAVSLLAKESALAFPAIAWAFARCHLNAEGRRSTRWVLAGLWCVAAAYLAARLKWMPLGAAAPLSMIADQPLPVRGWTFLRSFLEYLGLALLPLTLRTERHFAAAFSDWRAWLGLARLAGALRHAWRRRQERPYLLFGWVWFLAPLGPVSNLVPLALTMAEQWLYVPMMGLAWILAGLLDSRWPPPRPGTPAAAAPWLTPALACASLLLAARSGARALEWRDGPTLYRSDARRSPDSFVLQNNLGVELLRAGDRDGAERQFRRALALDERYNVARNNLGAMLEGRGDLRGALEAYRSAALADYELAYGNLARLLARLGRPQEAEAVLEQGARRHPFNAELPSLLGELRAQRRR
ncbi:MAG: glycosyltransferase family 39 protein [Elusimicrobia bacterium]|nr:glycosyltransferase family 39 protein [Elusimicrobiota bacterium]